MIKRLSTLWWLSGLNVQQFKDILEISNDTSQPIMSIKSFAGGELIFPSPIKEAFNEGKIKSLKDIL